LPTCKKDGRTQPGWATLVHILKEVEVMRVEREEVRMKEVGERREKVPSPTSGIRVAGVVEETEVGGEEWVGAGRGVVRTRVKFTSRGKKVLVNQIHHQFRAREVDAESRQKANV
jgi:hypothetical protein